MVVMLLDSRCYSHDTASGWPCLTLKVPIVSLRRRWGKSATYETILWLTKLGLKQSEATVVGPTTNDGSLQG